ncbi:glycosyltransferase [Nostoc sp. LEGE 06077]|uniref:glycosyltransferase family 2 protein n=1 Tax=Nostoc sp. LEGE 06077 TaxID=915325 RepID=UPI001880B796|nr:glycosyltransferase [Nostoc sp. LEGE 06077]MBE9209866.1 glycosyltransferase [Nostoc sp. LEGE 06077]
MKGQICVDDNYPLVSIVIGNYNYDRFINQAIDSALNQTYTNIEIIVVDDGSQDNSREIIKGYGDKIIPIFKENGGQPSVYNIAFAISKGEIICFLDSDDIFLPNKVEEIVNIFKSYKQIGWCFHSLQLTDKKGNYLNITTAKNFIFGESDFRAKIKSGRIPPYIPTSSALSFRRSLLEQILPMPTSKEITASDYYVKFMAVALEKGFMLHKNLTYQRIHDNNAATLRKDKLHMKAREYLFTGKWIRQELPQFEKFANKLLSFAIYMNWSSGNTDIVNIQGIRMYLDSNSILDKINIYSRAVYYYLSSLTK